MIVYLQCNRYRVYIWRKKRKKRSIKLVMGEITVNIWKKKKKKRMNRWWKMGCVFLNKQVKHWKEE